MIRGLVLILSLVSGLAQPTFTRDIAPILFENCSGCHRPGQSAPFSLLSYADSAKRSRQIAEVTAQRLMPPWLPDPRFGHYQGERWLAPRDITLFAEWAAAGAPEGDPAQLPRLPVWPEGWSLGKPDLVVQTPVYQVPAEGRDVYRNFVVPIPITATQYVAGIEFDPGNRRVAHHAFIRFDRTRGSRDLDETDPLPGFDGMDVPPSAQSPDGHFLSWQPGKRFSLNPEGMSWRLYPGSDLVLQVHLQPSGKAETIQSSIAFFFTDKPPRKFPLKLVLTSYDIDIPPGARNYTVTNSFKLPVDVEILSVLPHAHYLGKDLQGYALLPNGQTNWLMRIPNWNFNWQGDYRLAEPVFAPRGSTLVMCFSYDNSTNNPHNPHLPPVRVQYGMQTSDEMAELWIQALPKNPADYPLLRREVEKQTFEFAINYAKYRLKLNPNDARAHVKYAQALLALDKRHDAIPHLNAALNADPDYDEPRYFLGLIARLDDNPKLALEHFTRAVRLNPRNGKAFGNLGLLYLQERNLSAAGQSFLRAIDINPRDAISLDGLGVIAFQKREIDQAEVFFERAAAADPADPEIRNHLAQIRAIKSRGKAPPR